MVVASSIGADLAMAFLTHEAAHDTLSLTAGSSPKSKGHAPYMTPFLYLAIKSLYWSKGGTLKRSCGVTMIP
ncbi:MAG: hypothetical protein ACLTKF_10520 [Subdoligranulum sp.]